MTGREVLREALYLLNYTSPYGDIDNLQNAELHRRGLPLVNRILCDVLPVEGAPVTVVESMDDPLPVSAYTAAAVMPYGVAMLLAAGENDSSNQQMAASFYQQKRCSIPRAGSSITDTVATPQAE